MLENTTYLTKMVGKICCQESRGEPFKGYVKKQNTYCLRCKRRTDNKSMTAKQVVNKSIAPKSVCADCGAKKSVFVKEYKPNKKKKIVFTNYKNMQKYCKNCKKHTGYTFPKKLVLISKNKIK